MPSLLDLTGQRFGNLTVLRRGPDRKTSKPRIMWWCRCDCGKEKCIQSDYLRQGTISCGCLGSRHSFGKRMATLLTGKRGAQWGGIGDMGLDHWSRIRDSAIRRGLTITITHQECWDLFQAQQGRCRLTGRAIPFAAPGRRSRSDGMASLDRIDSSKGYVPGNIQWVHKTVQLMKNVLSQQDLIEWCREIVAYNAL